MNKEAIAISRQRLALPDSMTDEEIADGLRGSFLEAKIEFELAWRNLVQEVREFFPAVWQGGNDEIRTKKLG